jgi:ABC-type lipoprotein export system ATPase subunit
MIQLTNVRKTYRKGTEQIHALAEVSLSVERGEFVAVVGPPGSGKSTLMNIIGLLDRPDEGTYRLHGQDVSAPSADQLATLRNEQIGFVFQTFHLLARTSALENVELPLVYSDRPNVRGLGLRALERVGLRDRATHFPGELSGGQQQRVAIARALVLEPPLILADEPTGNLDSKSSGEIMDIFRQLHESGSTIVVITHDPAVSRHADRVLTIVDGRISADGQALTLLPADAGSGIHVQRVSAR